MKTANDVGRRVPVFQKSSYYMIRPDSIFSGPRALSNIFLMWVLLFSLHVFAAAQTTDPEWLTLERIFSREFDLQRFGGFRWLKTGDSFARLEPSPTVAGAMDLISYQI